MKFKKDSESLKENSELRILAEYNRRFKQLTITQKKVNKLRDHEMDEEAKKIQDLVKLLVDEIEAYFRTYRKILTKYGILPEYPLEINDITKEEATAWAKAHRKNTEYRKKLKYYQKITECLSRRIFISKFPSCLYQIILSIKLFKI